MKELAKLDQLPTDHGNWGPRRPSPSVIGVASRVLDDVKRGKLPFSSVMIAATSEGGIQVKWQDQRREFSLFIYPDSALEYFFKDVEGHSNSGSLSGMHQVNEYADRLLA